MGGVCSPGDSFGPLPWRCLSHGGTITVGPGPWHVVARCLSLAALARPTRRARSSHAGCRGLDSLHQEGYIRGYTRDTKTGLPPARRRGEEGANHLPGARGWGGSMGAGHWGALCEGARTALLCRFPRRQREDGYSRLRVAVPVLESSRFGSSDGEVHMLPACWRVYGARRVPVLTRPGKYLEGGNGASPSGEGAMKSQGMALSCIAQGPLRSVTYIRGSCTGGCCSGSEQGALLHASLSLLMRKGEASVPMAEGTEFSGPNRPGAARRGLRRPMPGRVRARRVSHAWASPSRRLEVSDPSRGDCAIFHRRESWRARKPFVRRALAQVRPFKILAGRP